jgi:hypothetical protein
MRRNCLRYSHPCTPKRRRTRKVTLTQALREAAKAGVSVAGAAIEDGKVTLTFGDTVSDTVSGTGTSGNPWDEVLSHAANQKRPS